MAPGFRAGIKIKYQDSRKLNLFLAGPRAAEAALGTQYQVNEVGNK